MKYLRICISVFVWLSMFLQAGAQNDTSKAFVKISGEVTKPLTLSLDDLATMKHSTVMVKGRDGKEHSYSGIPVQRLLELAGVTTGNDLRGENLAKYLLVKCADGYEIVFSLAEIDNSFTDRIALLADAYEDKPIAGEKGPFQLAVPGEKKPARSCFQVTELIIKFAKG